MDRNKILREAQKKDLLYAQKSLQDRCYTIEGGLIKPEELMEILIQSPELQEMKQNLETGKCIALLKEGRTNYKPEPFRLVDKAFSDPHKICEWWDTKATHGFIVFPKIGETLMSDMLHKDVVSIFCRHEGRPYYFDPYIGCDFYFDDKKYIQKKWEPRTKDYYPSEIYRYLTDDVLCKFGMIRDYNMISPDTEKFSNFSHMINGINAIISKSYREIVEDGDNDVFILEKDRLIEETEEILKKTSMDKYFTSIEAILGILMGREYISKTTTGVMLGDLGPECRLWFIPGENYIQTNKSGKEEVLSVMTTSRGFIVKTHKDSYSDKAYRKAKRLFLETFINTREELIRGKRAYPGFVPEKKLL